jgi:hypothetical protein
MRRWPIDATEGHLTARAEGPARELPLEASKFSEYQHPVAVLETLTSRQ